MLFRWLVELNEETIEQDIGLKIKNITKGGIVVGETNSWNAEGKWTKVPVIKYGIEVEFEIEPTKEQLEKLDLLFYGLKREEGKSLIMEIQELKIKVAELEKRQI